MYPNNIIARYFMLMPSVGFLIIFSSYYGWFKYQAKKIGNRVKIYPTIYYLSVLGFPFYVITCATVDGGQMAMSNLKNFE